MTAKEWMKQLRDEGAGPKSPNSPYFELACLGDIQRILDDGRVQGMREAAQKSFNEQDAAEDLSNAAKTLILNMNNLTEDLWVNLSNARNRFDAARQHRINNELTGKSHADKLAKGEK